MRANGIAPVSASPPAPTELPRCKVAEHSAVHGVRSDLLDLEKALRCMHMGVPGLNGELNVPQPIELCE